MVLGSAQGQERGFDAYLFDLDGTLIDSIDLIYRCYDHAAQTHLSISPPDEVWRQGLGTPLRDQLRAVTDDAAIIEAMVVSYREYHHLHHDQSIVCYPEVVETLTSLRARGVKLGIVTSKMRGGAERGLKLTGLLDFFDILVTADEVDHAKPHPEPVRKALDKLSMAPSGAVFIGDSPHDMASGRGAGVKTAGALWGPFAAIELEPESPSYFLSSPAAVLSL